MIPIILQTYNRISYTMEVISSIKNHLLYPNKLIVIDNASTDGTVKYLELLAELKIIDYLILNKENIGIAEPKNQGLEIVKDLSKEHTIKYVCMTDNDIVVPFMRPTCALTEIVKIMNTHLNVGMCGIDLNRDNSPDYQEWWWRLRQHPNTNPTFTEISIGFWFAVIRYEYFNDFKFIGGSKYGKIDESLRNYIGLTKKAKIGLLKGPRSQDNTQTLEKTGIHLGWREDFELHPEYVNFKKEQRKLAETEWHKNNRKW